MAGWLWNCSLRLHSFCAKTKRKMFCIDHWWFEYTGTSSSADTSASQRVRICLAYNEISLEIRKLMEPWIVYLMELRLDLPAHGSHLFTRRCKVTSCTSRIWRWLGRQTQYDLWIYKWPMQLIILDLSITKKISNCGVFANDASSSCANSI